MAPPRNRRPGFSRRAQYGLFLGYVVAIAGAVIGAILLVLSAFFPTAFSGLRLAVSEFTAPVSSGLAAAGGGIAAVPSAIGDHFGVMHENAVLKKQVADTHDLLLRARTLAYDNRRLKALLALRERDSETVVTARLVSSSASSTRRYALLNAGARQGVREGQPVRGPAGLVGRILEAGPDTARVLLIGDPESIVPVRRTRDGLAAIAAGRGDGWIEIKSVNLGNTVFNAGDVFVSSGTGGIYPPNVPVARIARTASDTALARPFEHPDSLDFALVQRAFFPLPPPVISDPRP